ncbi:hypothetical protein D3C73_1321340 [compost metagenome]
MVQLHLQNDAIWRHLSIRITSADKGRCQRTSFTIEQQITKARLSNTLCERHPLQEFQRKIAIFTKHTLQFTQRDNSEFPFIRHLSTVAVHLTTNATEFPDQIAFLLNGQNNLFAILSGFCQLHTSRTNEVQVSGFIAF